MTEDFNLVFPFQKINKEKRTVTGIATADNIDHEDDVIDFQASLDAFSDWIGNIREMHQPEAVGTMLDYRPVPVFYKGRQYQGIEVEAYVSKGAQNTWEKVLDGTLKGFSIGGKVLEREPGEQDGRRINKILKYMLGELSLVDNPCNPVGLLTMIKRLDDGSLESVNNNSGSVFYCDDHQLAQLDNDVCPIGMEKMRVIGQTDNFDAKLITKMISTIHEEGGKDMDLHENSNNDNVESMDTELTDQQKEGVLSSFGKMLFGQSQTVESVNTGTTTGATPIVVNFNVTDELNKSIATVESTVTTEVAEAEIQETVDDSTEGENDMDLEKVLESFGTLLDSKLDTLKADITSSVDEKIEAIEKSVSEVKEATEESVTKLNEEVEKVSSAGAISKSTVVDEVDEEVVEETITKTQSFWAGKFVNPELVKALGYES